MAIAVNITMEQIMVLVLVEVVFLKRAGIGHVLLNKGYKMYHQPVLLNEVLGLLQPKTNQNYIDCTMGGGGHLIPILKATSPYGKMLAIDLDPTAHRATKENIRQSGLEVNRVVFIQDNFRNLKKIIEQNKFNNISGILIDLGVSSTQIDDEKRGFGFSAEKLDMRFDPAETNITAEYIINKWPKEKLTEIFKNYGEERLAGPIASKIIEYRKKDYIESPQQLKDLVSKVYHSFFKTYSKLEPATKVFQALRIAINDELESLRLILPVAAGSLARSGRLAVISFHSLEDRITKDYFKQESRDCLCPPQAPLCQCHHEKILKIITKKPLIAQDQEIKNNPRSRSAKLRVAEKL